MKSSWARYCQRHHHQDAEISRKHARFVRVEVDTSLGPVDQRDLRQRATAVGLHLLESGELIMFGENVGWFEHIPFDPDATLSGCCLDVTPTSQTYAVLHQRLHLRAPRGSY
jgi:hypothetical protein